MPSVTQHVTGCTLFYSLILLLIIGYRNPAFHHEQALGTVVRENGFLESRDLRANPSCGWATVCLDQLDRNCSSVGL